MTVKEFIERLSEFDPNMLVSINGSHNIEYGEVRLGNKGVEIRPDCYIPDVSDIINKLRDAIDDANSGLLDVENALDDICEIIDDLEDLDD